MLAIALIDVAILVGVLVTSRLRGLRLWLLSTGVFYAAKTFTSQLETWYFMKNVTPQMLPGLFLMTLPVLLLSAVASVLCLGVLAGACPAEPPLHALPVARSTPTQQADDLFLTRCLSCHAAADGGTGAVPVSSPRPQDFHDARWQASVTDAEIELAIVRGGTAVGRSSDMPPHPDLSARPDVVTALRVLIRKFR